MAVTFALNSFGPSSSFPSAPDADAVKQADQASHALSRQFPFVGDLGGTVSVLSHYGSRPSTRPEGRKTLIPLRFTDFHTKPTPHVDRSHA